MNDPEGDQWQTPDIVLERVRKLFGTIDCDPASSYEANKRIGATTYYTIEDNGLEQDWHGRVWLNPPYSKVNGESQAAAFLRHLMYQHREGFTTEALFLTNVCTGARWFRDMWGLDLCFFYKRLRFVHPTLKSTSPRYDNVIAYVGLNRIGFKQAFGDLGHVVFK